MTLRVQVRRLLESRPLARGQKLAARTAQHAYAAMRAPRVTRLRSALVRRMGVERYGVWYALAFGMTGITLGVVAFDHLIGWFPNPGLLYLLTIAYITFRWGWRYGIVATGVQMFCAFLLFYPPLLSTRGMRLDDLLYMLTMAGASAAIISLIESAKRGRSLASREAGRYAVLTHLGEALAGATDETDALGLVTRAVATCTSSDFAAVALAGLDDDAPEHARGILYLAPRDCSTLAECLASGAAAPIHRCGPLAPLYSGKPVFLPQLGRSDELADDPTSDTDTVALGALDGSRSIIAVPLIDHEGKLRGGIALGHREPSHYTEDDLALLTGLGRLSLITAEHNHLLQTAQARAQELNVIFEHVGDAISLLDAQGQTVRENRAARRLRLRLTQGVWPSEDDDARQAGARERDVLHGMPFALMDPDGVAREYEVRRATLVATDASLANAPTPAIAGAVVVYRDVTETRRLIEERRARTEAETRRALLQRVVDQVPAGVYLVRGPEGKLALGNAVAMRMFGAAWPVGMTVGEFIQKSGLRILSHDGVFIRPENLATTRTLATGRPVLNAQAVMRQPNGDTIAILVNTVALEGAALGESDGVIDPHERAALVVMQDVSALKEVERLKDDFIAVAAHELKNPVMEIKGNVDTLLLQSARGKGQSLDPWQREALDGVERGMSRLVHLTNDLLDVSRIQAGLLELRQEPHDLVSLVRRVVKSAQAISPRHTIKFCAPQPHVVAEVDERRVEQVISNLISNAIKYSPDADCVLVTVEAGAAEACVRVTDRGIGIPRDQQPLVFQRFARADNARDRHIEGNGLGLYLSRELVERHGGRIWFESTPGAGTTFFVALPLSVS